MLVYYLLLVLTPFWQYSRLPQFGESLTLIKLIGVVSILAALVRMALYPRALYLLRWAESRLFFVLLLIAALSAATLSFRGWAYGPMLSYVSVAAFLFVTLVFVDSVARLERACSVIGGSLLVASAYVFTDYFRWGSQRPGGVFGDPNYFALAAICFLPVSIKLASSGRGLQRVVMGLASLGMIGAILLGASRGGLLCLVFCCAYLFAQSQRRMALAAGAALVLVPLVVFLPQTGIDRFDEEHPGAQASSSARMNLLTAGWKMVEANPLTGVGLGNFKPLSALYEPAVVANQIGHNTYLEIAAELGIPALLVFLLLLWCSWRSARGAAAYFQEAALPRGEEIARGFEIGIACFAVGAVFLSAEYCKQFWMLLFLGVALKRIGVLHAQQSRRTQLEMNSGEAMS